jgi:hypothetical protein
MHAGNGTYLSPGGARYHLDYVLGVQREHNVSLDYIGESLVFTVLNEVCPRVCAYCHIHACMQAFGTRIRTLLPTSKPFATFSTQTT